MLAHLGERRAWRQLATCASDERPKIEPSSFGQKRLPQVADHGEARRNVAYGEVFDAKALLDYLQTLGASVGALEVENLSTAPVLGAVKGQRVISFVLAFSQGVAAGVVGNAVYEALKSATGAQCVIAGEPVDKATAADKATLEAKIKSSAKPYGRTPGH